jgi:hypothetical protein
VARECRKSVTAGSCDRDRLTGPVFPGSPSREPASFIGPSRWPVHLSAVVADLALSWRSRVAPYMGSAQLHRRWIGLAYGKKTGLRLSVHRGILGAHCSGWRCSMPDGCSGSLDSTSLEDPGSVAICLLCGWIPQAHLHGCAHPARVSRPSEHYPWKPCSCLAP